MPGASPAGVLDGETGFAVRMRLRGYACQGDVCELSALCHAWAAT